MSRITLEQANCIIVKAFETAHDLALQPLAVVVTDAGGQPVAFQRQDGASIGRFQIALGKAAGALALGVSSRKLGEMAQERPWFVGALAAGAAHPVIPAAGGIILTDDTGATIGAVGVTGDSSDNDELCALRAIAAAGLHAQG